MALPVVPQKMKTTGDTALAGKDGKELARLIATAKDAGADTLTELIRSRLSSYRGRGPFFDQVALVRLSESIAAVNATAELMGRARVREMQDRALRAGGLSKFKNDKPWSTFADSPPGVIQTPAAALEYFTSLVPKLGVDPERFVGEQRRRAFQLAASTNDVLTKKIQREIAVGISKNQGVADVTARIREALSASGVGVKHNQYAEMVYRTNANDAFQTGLYEEGRHEDVRDVFPVWRYLIVDDSRTGDDHRPKGGRFYPAEVSFADARGPRPFNCRCSMQWVDFSDWSDYVARGAKLENQWR